MIANKKRTFFSLQKIKLNNIPINRKNKNKNEMRN